MEHSSTFWQAFQEHYPAVLWALYVNLATVLKGVDGSIVGSLVGLEPFRRQYGYEFRPGEWVIEAHWLGAFNYANNLGCLAGAVLSGPAYDGLGPRVMMSACCCLSVAFTLVQFYSQTPAQLFAGDLLNGFAVSFFPICASAYIGEICPMALRGFAASMTNLAFVVGQFTASGILKGTETIDGRAAYLGPIAAQWALPGVILLSVYFCPDPPFWLARRGHVDEAARSIRRLASSAVDPGLKLAHVRETVRLEQALKSVAGDDGGGEDGSSAPSLSALSLDVFRGADLRRLTICVMAYIMQGLTGNVLFISYAVYFFRLAGLSASDAFSMNLGLTSIGFVGNLLSWLMMPYVGRRTAYLWGTSALMTLCFVIATLDLAPREEDAAGAGAGAFAWAQCALIVVCNFVYDITLGPYCYVLLSEVSSVRLRGITVGLSTVAVQVISILFAAVIPYAMNEDRGNWRGKIGFLFAGLSVFCVAYCYFFLPETKGRTFEELDIMFEKKISSRMFSRYQINGVVAANEELE
ncbi:MFS transporter, SP family, solute carrier family 2 (facilitated glucose transporter), member 8 [Geosmithia morbida]|uniref:MFS transporter, SP family, solute carrier family 2 (Facilitated glucose transporter), member 8 n=1 Tax=Geosmithia morbida TaxID=1094350 RepID=A0A9P5D760_9HYPO|nr:MFS transporter, SP family, solute carrier family 2 (facilitated glucose transporter), member 8 [Geosmithia morbida]KAF4124204.1 MFS transporter, SP family, solute carrier family 2 (facilitated glucose transporter), member 8 [Geosmithia morbida]